MAYRVSLRSGLSLASLVLGGCLLADVGINEDLETEVSQALGGTSNSGDGVSGSGGGSGSAGGPSAAGSGGSAGNGEMPPSMGGSANSGEAGSGPMSSGGSTGGADNPPAGGAGSSGVPSEPSDSCPQTTDREEACISYCSLFTEVCEEIEGGGLRAYDYENQLDCVNRCVGEMSWEVGTLTNGNTIMCRCLHSFLAQTQGANTHCYHARFQPTGMCL